MFHVLIDHRVIASVQLVQGVRNDVGEHEISLAPEIFAKLRVLLVRGIQVVRVDSRDAIVRINFFAKRLTVHIRRRKYERARLTFHRDPEIRRFRRSLFLSLRLRQLRFILRKGVLWFVTNRLR